MIYAKAKSTALLAVGLVTLVGCHRTPPQLPLQPLMIAGKAMQPALKEGDRILVTEDLKVLKRGDVVVYHYPADQNQSFISRIIGLPNEEVEVNEGRVFVNGQALNEPYVDADNNHSLLRRLRVKIPEGSYFVMGDNRDNANDSRAWGPLAKRFIYGKLVLEY